MSGSIEYPLVKIFLTIPQTINMRWISYFKRLRVNSLIPEEGGKWKELDGDSKVCFCVTLRGPNLPSDGAEFLKVL